MTKSSHATLKALRLLHLYLGIFTAPALLFFAFTGALQTFSLHETTRGSSYQPPEWAMVLAQIHKKQTPVVAKKPSVTPKTDAQGMSKPDGPAAAKSGEPQREAPHPAGRQHHPLPLKIFFLIVSVGLALSTGTGIYMAYKYARNKTLITALLVVGAVIPLVLVLI